MMSKWARQLFITAFWIWGIEECFLCRRTG